MLFLLSFANASGPLGFAIVEAKNYREAVVTCTEKEIHPGGFCRMGEAPKAAHESWLNVLLDEEDAKALEEDPTVVTRTRPSTIH